MILLCSIAVTAAVLTTTRFQLRQLSARRTIDGSAGATSSVIEPAAAYAQSVELPTPNLSPSVITPDVPTFVTFSIALSDTALRLPRLQYLDSTGQWATIAKLDDKGKSPDEIKKDRRFALRLRFLDAAGSTQIAIPQRRGVVKVKASVPSTPQLRLTAQKEGQGYVISPTFSVSPMLPAPISLGTHPATIAVPKTIGSIDATNPDNVYLLKNGPDGYSIRIFLGANTTSLPLIDWIRINTLGGADESDRFEAVTVSGLPGFRFSATEEGGSYQYVWLADTSNQRVFVFEIQPRGGQQADTIQDNAPEIMSILNSLQL